MIITHNGTILTNDGVVLNNIITSPSFQNTYSLDFDGMDDYLDVGSIAMVNSVNKLSFSVWIKTPSFATQGIVLGRTGSSSIYDGVYIIVRTSGKISFAIGAGYWDTVDTISLNTWTHIACVFDGTLTGNENRAKIYINGILKGGTIFSNPIPNITGTGLNTTFNIGAAGNPSGPSAFFNGNMDEVSLYDYSLSASEVTDIYNLGTPTDLSLLATPPLHWYRNGDNGAYKDPQWLIPSNENKDKVSNYSMELDGLDDYIEILPNGLGSIYAVQEYSIEFWFKTNFGEPYEVLWSYDYTDHSPPYYAQHIRINTPSNAGGNGNIRLLTNNNGIYTPNPHLITPNTIALYDNTWHHIVATRTLTTKDIYLDGINVASGSYGSETTNYYAQEVWQGRANFSNGYTKGNFGFVKFYNSRLTSTNISDLYNGGTPIDIPGITPISHWKMGEEATFSGGVWTVPDQIGSNDGTSANMTIEDRVGTAPSSSNNALSFNMDLIDRVEDTPPTP